MVDELGPLRQFTDFNQALAETNPNAVSVSSYTETHHPFAMAALEAECHVFVENFTSGKRTPSTGWVNAAPP